MKVIVHIGTEKTGSTSIQKLLSGSRDKLAAQGYHFLQCAGETNNRALPSYCMRSSRDDDFLRGRMLDTDEKKQQFRDQLRQDFDREIATLPDHIHTVVISSEHFHSLLLHPDELATLKALLDACFSETRIIVYLRNQADTAVSFYATAIRAGHAFELDEFLAGCDESSAYLNYDSFLSLWENTFGIEAIQAAIFDSEDFYHGNLLQDFIHRMDSALLEVLETDIAYENESPGYMGQLVGRAINLAFPRPTGPGPANPMRRKLVEVAYRNFKADGECIDAARKRELMSRFTAPNERVRRRYFPTRQALFRERGQQDLDTAVKPDFSAALSDVFATLANDSSVVPPRYIDIFRDAALALEDDSPELAWELMSLAQRMRPSATFLEEKLAQYRQKLGK